MERFTGCLLGMAVGDALGAPLQALKDGHIQQIYGEVTDYVDSVAGFPDRPARWRLKGLYSADTQQALAVADVLAVQGELDLKAIADVFVRLADEGPADRELGAHRGADYILRRAVAAMREADDPRRCGQPSPDNGAVVRAIPIGLFHAGDDETLGRNVIEATLMTRNDPRAIAAALAVARVVGWLVQDEIMDAPEIARQLSPWLHDWETQLGDEYADFLAAESGYDRLHQFSTAARVLPSLLREDDLALAAKTIVNEANALAPPTHIAQSHDAFAPASVLMALYRALSARSLSAELAAAVNGGGDAGTVGAMVGAMLGARFGEAAISPLWLRGLLNADPVRQRAIALFRREVDWTNWDDYVETEKELSQREAEFLSRVTAEHRRQVEKREERQAERRARGAKAAAPPAAPPDLGFAPPPQIWLAQAKGEDLDPIQAKKERALRGRKRIGWKEDRRRDAKGDKRDEDEE